MKTKGRRQSSNVEVSPFTAAQKASFANSSQPGLNTTLMPQRSPFEVLAERLKADQTATALGMGDVQAKMDTAIQHDALATKMSQRTRWGAPTGVSSTVARKVQTGK